MQKRLLNSRKVLFAALLFALCSCGNKEAGFDVESEPAFVVSDRLIHIPTIIIEDPALEEAVEPTDAPEQIEVEPEDNTIDIVMVGDILMHTPLNKLGVCEDGTKDFNFMFENTREVISEADIAMVNMEVVLGGEELSISGYPTFNTYTEVGDALVAAGFDVVLSATNHALDRGGEGVKSTCAFWRDNYPEVSVTGIYDNAEDYNNLLIYEEKGIKIAILNYTYGTNGIALPGDMPFAVRKLNKDVIKQDMEKAREEADFVIVCPHWGTEYKFEADDKQKTWAQLFADEGADLIIGTHPHVIEPHEEIEASDGRVVPVYYSLGNYINCTSETKLPIARRMIGAMAEVTLLIEDSGEVSIKECSQRELVTYVNKDKSVINTFFVEDFTPEMAESSYTNTIDRGFTYDYIHSLWSEIFGG